METPSARVPLNEDSERNATAYAHDPEFFALLAAVRAVPTDLTARLVLADWVQDHNDEAEAAAIRASQSFRVDVVPGLALTLASLTVRLIQLAAVICERPELATALVEIADAFHHPCALTRPLGTPPEHSARCG